MRWINSCPIVFPKLKKIFILMEYNDFITIQLSAKHANFHASMLFEQFTLSLSMPKSVPKILTKLKGEEVLSKLNSEIIYT